MPSVRRIYIRRDENSQPQLPAAVSSWNRTLWKKPKRDSSTARPNAPRQRSDSMAFGRFAQNDGAAGASQAFGKSSPGTHQPWTWL